MLANIPVFLSSFIDYFTILLLAFSIFRLPIKYNVLRLISATLVITIVSFLQREVLHVTDYFIFVNLVVGMSAIMFLFQLPIAYSLLVFASGYLVSATIQMIVVVIPLVTGILTLEQIQSQLMMIPTILLISLVLYIIHKKRLGFMLIANRFMLKKEKLRPRDFFVAGVFVSTVTMIQSGIVAIKNNSNNLTILFVLLGVTIVMAVGLFVTYLINIKEIEERYFRKNKL
ncbi:hypothetical protein [Paenibacillus thermotolerans]|uniref:hypothetical protein n=1 Tax=Paenibacillus thermotolerans TaxID=3027807 RepID=UPI0023686779|nr:MULTISPECIES: hypothetical protein [unclassified Paenibacillus]